MKAKESKQDRRPCCNEGVIPLTESMGSVITKTPSSTASVGSATALQAKSRATSAHTASRRRPAMMYTMCDQRHEAERRAGEGQRENVAGAGRDITTSVTPHPHPHLSRSHLSQAVTCFVVFALSFRFDLPSLQRRVSFPPDVQLLWFGFCFPFRLICRRHILHDDNTLSHLFATNSLPSPRYHHDVSFRAPRACLCPQWIRIHPPARCPATHLGADVRHAGINCHYGLQRDRVHRPQFWRSVGADRLRLEQCQVRLVNAEGKKDIE